MKLESNIRFYKFINYIISYNINYYIFFTNGNTAILLSVKSKVEIY
jgi:hypothetical protein